MNAIFDCKILINIKYRTNLFLILILIFGSYSCKNRKVDLSKYLHDKYYRIDTINFPNGNIAEKKFIESKSSYVDVFYYQSGNIQSICPIINNKSQGEFIDFYENGSCKWIRFYDRGNKIGIEKKYFINGNIDEIEDHTKNTYNDYYDNGNIETIHNNDSTIEYFLNGAFYSKYILLKKDSFLYELFNEDSTLAFKGCWYSNILIKNGVPFSGIISCLFLNKDTALYNQYNNGKEEGRFFTKYGNGKLSTKGQIRNGVRIGVLERYYENGNRLIYFDFNTGEQTTWYDNGQMWTHRNSEKEKFHYWYENGKQSQ